VADHQFREFLKNRLGRDDILDRRFIQHAIDDIDLPDPESWEVLKAHIEHQPHATADTVADAEYLWQQFKLGR
jgi:hypothetical protein